MNAPLTARLLSLLGVIFALTSSLSGIDLDMDGLSDVWEQQYGAENLLAGDDTDGDGYSNLSESTAGTDPFDSNHHPKLEVSGLDPDSLPLVFTFPTQAGKRYQFQDSLDLQTFLSFGEPITGDSSPLTVALDPNNQSTISGNVIQQFWADVPGNDLTTLINNSNFPGNPDGETRLPSLEPPSSPVLALAFECSLSSLLPKLETTAFSYPAAARPNSPYLMTAA